MEVINAALSAYKNSGEIDISQVEGFVRQILGWREYIRAVYWVNMPDYAQRNALNAQRDLPDFLDRKNENDLYETSQMANR